MSVGTEEEWGEVGSPTFAAWRREEAGRFEVFFGCRGGGCSATWRSGDNWLSRCRMGACGGPNKGPERKVHTVMAATQRNCMVRASLDGQLQHRCTADPQTEVSNYHATM